jgi:hypothetical protein
LLLRCGPAPQPPERKTAAPVQPVTAVKITHFYAGSQAVIQGQAVTLCYGVEDAVAVRLRPPVEELKPGYNRCFQTTLERTTTYTLVAEGADGRTVSQSVTVELKAAPKAPPPPAPIPALITMFVASASEVPAGMPVTLCYGAPEAQSLSIEPAVEPLKPTRRDCFIVKPDRATTYTITARAPDGYVETAQVTVKIR